MTRRFLFIFLLSLYLITGGGKGYSIDGAFGYEMAKTVLLDPSHAYFRRFRSAFARWGALMPLLGQPFVLAGDGLSHLAPERDDLIIQGHQFRVEEWPAVGPGAQSQVAAPRPEGSGPFAELGLVSFLSGSVSTPQGTVVAVVRLWQGQQHVDLPIRAGIETAEWAYDRPDIAGTVQHTRPPVAGHWIGQPRGNLYFADLTLPGPMQVDRWELLAVPPAANGAAAAAPAGGTPTWYVRAAAFKDTAGAWQDARTGERYWSARQTRDFFTHLLYSTVNAFVTAGSAVLLYNIAGQFGYGRTTSLIVALGFGVATMAWPYAKLDFSEPASTLFVLLAVWCLYRGCGRDLSTGPSPLRGGGTPVGGMPLAWVVLPARCGGSCRSRT